MPAKWTFMVYVAADNNLSPWAFQAFEEMRAVGSNADLHIVAQFDRKGDWPVKRYFFRPKKGRRSPRPFEDPIRQVNAYSGDPKTLAGFLKWAMTNHPAQQYALVMWGHGIGWEAEQRRRSGLKPGTDPLWPLGTRMSRAPAKRGSAGNQPSRTSITTCELGVVLRELKSKRHQELELLGMDACFMSNWEVAYQVRDAVEFFVASEDYQIGDWPYSKILQLLKNNPNMGARELASGIVETCKRAPRTSLCTKSALDLSKVEAAAPSLDRLASVLINEMPTARTAVLRAHYDSWYFDDLQDIASFCRELTHSEISPTIEAAAKDVVKKFKQDPNNLAFDRSSNDETKYADCGGVTVYLPFPEEDSSVSGDYHLLAFAKGHAAWLRMLRKYHEGQHVRH